MEVEVKVALVGILCTVLGYLFSYFMEQTKHKWNKEERRVAERRENDMKFNSLVVANKTVILFVIRFVGREYLRQGEITLEQKETIDDLHRAYKGLGGNGDLDTIMEELDELPVSIK